MPPRDRSPTKANRAHQVSRSALLLPKHRANERRDAAALESRFLRLPPELAEAFRSHVVQEPFARPLPARVAVLERRLIEGPDTTDRARLTCPRRPKWHYTDTKAYVDANEAGMFRQWLASLDAEQPGVEPTFVERNLEVWRQLWRVCEASDILCILADCRMPLLHFCDSLKTYVTTLKPPKPLILVLTKADLVSPDAIRAWKEYFLREAPDMQIIAMESYSSSTNGTAHHRPGTDDWCLVSFVDAIKRAHETLCTPHPRVAADAARLAAWKPRVYADVDWTALLEPDGVQPLPISHTHGHRKPYISIGLIGQPNVGKSSLLNALLGRKAVRASATPGKTKHLQTIHWTRDVRLVDCPGLVFPGRSGVRRQVFANVIPRQSAAATIAWACTLMPLERILGFPGAETTDELLTAYADARSYVTAKAGRSDTSRAANDILRFLQNARWSFWPPAADVQSDSGAGIWLGTGRDGPTFDLSDDDDEDMPVAATSPPSPAESRSSRSDEAATSVAVNAFALLEVTDA